MFVITLRNFATGLDVRRTFDTLLDAIDHISAIRYMDEKFGSTGWTRATLTWVPS